MRRQTPIAEQLYHTLYPHPTPQDPSSFAHHLARNLVPEVRIEVATFYGNLNTTEARYPGLNYCHPPHRMRLGRFKHHRRLFDAFDALSLTYNEIQDFCCWEGTKWARERYERDEGITVLDTTGNEIGPYVDRRELQAAGEARRRNITRKTEISVIVEEPRGGDARDVPVEMEEEDDEDEEEEDDLGADSGSDIERANQLFHEASLHRTAAMNTLAARRQSRRPPMDMDQDRKDETERRTLPAPFLMRAPPRASGYVPLSASAAAASAASAAPASPAAA